MLYVPHDEFDNNNNIIENNKKTNENCEIIFDLNEFIILLVDQNEIDNINNNKLKNSEFKLIELSKLKKTRFIKKNKKKK